MNVFQAPSQSRIRAAVRSRAAKRRIVLGCAAVLLSIFLPWLFGFGLAFSYVFSSPEEIARGASLHASLLGSSPPVAVTPGIYSTENDIVAEFQSRARPRKRVRPLLYGVDVVREYPHDPQAFTQGLVYGGGGVLYESTGLNGQSSVREVDLETGQVTRITSLPPTAFGEGLAYAGGKLLQVTWQSSEGYVYDPATLALERTITTDLGDGWGLAADPVSGGVWATTGAASLYLLNGSTFHTTRRVDITDGGRPVKWVNELEVIDGEVWANVWQTDCIARIDPGTGAVVGWVLLHDLTRATRDRVGPNGAKLGVGMDVLNGIALDADRGRLLITGKLWPALFHVRLRDMPNTDADVANARHLCIHA